MPWKAGCAEPAGKEGLVVLVSEASLQFCKNINYDFRAAESEVEKEYSFPSSEDAARHEEKLFRMYSRGRAAWPGARRNRAGSCVELGSGCDTDRFGDGEVFS